MTEEKLVTVGVIIKDKPNLDTFKVIGFRIFSVVDASLFDISIKEFFDEYSYIRVIGLSKEDEKNIKIDTDNTPYLESSTSLSSDKTCWFLGRISMYPLIYNGAVVGSKRIARLLPEYYLVKNADLLVDIFIYINLDNESVGLRIDDFDAIDTFNMDFDADSVIDIEVVNSLDCGIFGADANNSGLYIYGKNAVLFMWYIVDTLIIPNGIENVILASRLSQKLKRVVFST